MTVEQRLALLRQRMIQKENIDNWEENMVMSIVNIGMEFAIDPSVIMEWDSDKYITICQAMNKISENMKVHR